ncbi:MAG: hypothetical protein WCA89_03780 [Terracidiphilus sp.]|jgi:hypothetical protein
MAIAVRKRKIRHIKLHAMGGNATVQFGPKTVTVTVTIPRQHLGNRLK